MKRVVVPGREVVWAVSLGIFFWWTVGTGWGWRYDKGGEK